MLSGYNSFKMPYVKSTMPEGGMMFPSMLQDISVVAAKAGENPVASSPES